MYDKKRYFENEIMPLLQEIQQRCNENRIPYFAAYGVKMDDKGMFTKGDGIFCMSLIPEVLGLKTNDSYFSEFLNIMNGAHTVYRQSDEFDVDL